MTLPPLDPRFGKLVDLMRSTTHEAESASARAKAEAIVAASGLTFEKALAQLNYERIRAANPGNFLAGFDEFQEISNPGHLARRAVDKAERKRIWAEKRAGILKRYGSVEAVLAPCRREQLILKAVKPWRVAQKRPWQRWTSELKGWSSIMMTDKMPADLRAAIEGAYPMPITFKEACAELGYWRQRDDEMSVVIDETGTGLCDTGLDHIATVRMEIIRDIVDYGMRLATLPEIVERFRQYREGEVDDYKVEEALYRDLVTLVETGAHG